MGLSMEQVGNDLAAMLSGNFVNRFDIDGRSYKVIPQVERIGRLTPEQLIEMHVSGPDGHVIPLGSIASLKRSIVPRTLNRFQQLNAVKISGVAPRSTEAGLRVLESAAAKTLPTGYRIDYTGESRQLRQEAGKFLPALMLALVLIFLVLAAQFNSFRDPFVILAGSVPLAIFGALIFTFLQFSGPPGTHFALTDKWTSTLNIYSQVGLVTLAGLVSKNGILIVQFANAQQALGLSKIEAVKVAAATRLRPILMTTVATVSGHFPLTLRDRRPARPRAIRSVACSSAECRSARCSRSSSSPRSTCSWRETTARNANARQPRKQRTAPTRLALRGSGFRIASDGRLSLGVNAVEW